MLDARLASSPAGEKGLAQESCRRYPTKANLDHVEEVKTFQEAHLALKNITAHKLTEVITRVSLKPQKKDRRRVERSHRSCLTVADFHLPEHSEGRLDTSSLFPLKVFCSCQQPKLNCLG
jgi:hypothetical protein